jgi:hypothetical protein
MATQPAWELIKEFGTPAEIERGAIFFAWGRRASVLQLAANVGRRVPQSLFALASN